MGTFSFRTGLRVRIDDIDSTFLRKLDDETWQIEEDRTKRIREYKTNDLLSLYQSSKLKVSRGSEARAQGELALTNAEGKDWERAKVRRLYVLAVLDLPCRGKLTREAISRVWRKLEEPKKAPSVATVHRWKIRYLQSGKDLASLLPYDANKGNRQSRYPEESLDIVAEAINDVYLTPERNTIQDTVDEASDRTNKENRLRPRSDQLPLPTFRLVRASIEKIPAYDVYAARYGRTAAEKRFRAVLKHHTTVAPLERAQIDHTPLDLIVIDDDSLLPLGRPYVTSCIDCNTRCMLGMHISFEPPSSQTVARCLQHAFMPKTSLLASYPELKNPWLAYGVMSILDVDNGAEFHGESFENGCYSHGIEIHYSPRRKAWFKGTIERFQKTFNEGVSRGIPGTTFSNILEKEDYDPSKFAVVRWSTLKKIANIWVVDVYHQKVHRSLGMPPALKWASSIRQEDIPLPENPTALNFIFGKREERTLTHKGIELHGLFYNSADMTSLRRRLGDSLRVEVRIDTSNLGQIVVLAPDRDQIYDVPCLNSAYAASLSLYQHRICKRFANKFLHNYSSEGWLEAKARIREIVEEEILHKKRRTRARAARYKYAEPTESSTIETGRQEPSLPASPNDPPNSAPESILKDENNKPSGEQRPESVSDVPRRRITPIYCDRSPSENQPK